MKHLKKFNEADASYTEDLFSKFFMEYGLELEPVATSQPGKFFTVGDFTENPIIVDSKFIGLINSTNQKIKLSMDIMVVCRFDYYIISYKTKVPFELQNKANYRNNRQVSGTLDKLVNFFRTETVDNKISITKIFMDVYI